MHAYDMVEAIAKGIASKRMGVDAASVGLTRDHLARGFTATSEGASCFVRDPEIQWTADPASIILAPGSAILREA